MIYHRSAGTSRRIHQLQPNATQVQVSTASKNQSGILGVSALESHRAICFSSQHWQPLKLPEAFEMKVDVTEHRVDHGKALEVVANI